MNLLCLTPGREMGTAVFEDGELVYFGVRDLRKEKSRKGALRKTEKITLSLIRRYDVRVIVLEKPFYVQSRGSRLIRTLVRGIRQMAQDRRYRLVEMDIRTARQLIITGERATKIKVAKCLVQSFPELFPYKDVLESERFRYWQSLFDAVTLGVAVIKKFTGV